MAEEKVIRIVEISGGGNVAASENRGYPSELIVTVSTLPSLPTGPAAGSSSTPPAPASARGGTTTGGTAPPASGASSS